MSFEMMKTKRKLKGMSDSAILLIPQMTDQKTIYMVRLLMEIEYQAFFLHQKEVWSMATLRALQLTLANGRADRTPYVFASYGNLHAYLGNNKEAYRFGELAMKLTDITSEKSSMAQTTCKASFFCLIHANTSLVSFFLSSGLRREIGSFPILLNALSASSSREML